MHKKKIAAFLTAAAMTFGMGSPLISAKYAPYSIEAQAASESEKKTEAFVERMYTLVLGRKPDPNGLKNWTSKLTSHTAKASDIVMGFFFSDEYKNKKKTSYEMVTDCYNAMLGRIPDSQGLKTWGARFDIGMTVESVCSGFIGSNEFKGLCKQYGIEPGTITMRYARDENFKRTSFVYRLYKNCLNREPDIAGLEDWCKKLKNGTTGTSIAYGFFFSKEFTGKGYTNTSYVTLLYTTILGRLPDNKGLQGWVKKLDDGSSREYIANGFLFSDEFKKQCSEAGVVLGNKIPVPEDKPAEKMPDAKYIKVNNILQDPELPTGCEVVALTMLLNHLGYSVDKLTLSDKYLPKMDFYKKDGKLYGADYKTTFAGNPRNKNSYGCLAPCIVTTANKYLKEQKSKLAAYDISGADFDTLLEEYTAKDKPILVWITGWNLIETKLTDKWYTPDNKLVQWLANEHCVVLNGYDKTKGIIYASDSLYGNVYYDYAKFKQRYIDLGKQAVCIK